MPSAGCEPSQPRITQTIANTQKNCLYSGRKVAERIVTELKSKAPAFAGAASGTIGLKQELGDGVAPTPVADAVSALANLGYSRDVAANAVAAALKAAGEGADTGTLIRLGLKELAR